MDILWLKPSNQGRHIVRNFFFCKINIQKHAHQLLLLCHGLIKKIALSPMMWYQVVISCNVAHYLVLFHFGGRKNYYLWG